MCLFAQDVVGELYALGVGSEYEYACFFGYELAALYEFEHAFYHESKEELAGDYHKAE